MNSLRAQLEAVLMVIDEPVTPEALGRVLDLPAASVEDELVSLAATYDREGRGFSLRPIGSGWRIYSRAEYAGVVEAFLLDGQRARLTQAALETLAVVAYRQPVPRAAVSAVRGVNVDGVMRTLLARDLIAEVGADPVHGAILYGTTDYFLQRLGLDSLDELPPIAHHLPEMDTLDEVFVEVDEENV